jgi:hypothetical protein
MKKITIIITLISIVLISCETLDSNGDKKEDNIESIKGVIRVYPGFQIDSALFTYEGNKITEIVSKIRTDVTYDSVFDIDFFDIYTTLFEYNQSEQVIGYTKRQKSLRLIDNYETNREYSYEIIRTENEIIIKSSSSTNGNSEKVFEYENQELKRKYSTSTIDTLQYTSPKLEFEYDSNGNISTFRQDSSYVALAYEYDNRKNPFNQINSILGYPYYDRIEHLSNNNPNCFTIKRRHYNQVPNLPLDSVNYYYRYDGNKVIYQESHSVSCYEIRNDSTYKVNDYIMSEFEIVYE